MKRYQRGGFLLFGTGATFVALWLALYVGDHVADHIASVTFKRTEAPSVQVLPEDGPDSGELGVGPCDLSWSLCWQRT